jgi:phosphoserine phosphatase
MHEEWAVQQSALFKGKRVKDAERIIYPVPYAFGLRELMAATKGRCLRGILTTGLNLVAEKAAEDMNLDFCFCNSLRTEEGFFTGTLNYDVPLWSKHLILEEFCRKRKINLREVCYFGDSENDVLCMKLAGLSVAVDPKDNAARAAAMHTVNDFVEVKKILNGKIE